MSDTQKEPHKYLVRKWVSQKLAPGKHGWMVTGGHSTDISTPFPLCLTGWAWLVKKTIQSWQQRCRKHHGKLFFFLHGNCPSEPWHTFHYSPKGSIEVFNRFSLHPCEEKEWNKDPTQLWHFICSGQQLIKHTHVQVLRTITAKAQGTFQEGLR